MKKKIYFIDRYDFYENRNIKKHSGYEQIVKYANEFKRIKTNSLLSKIILKLFKIDIPKNYIKITVSKELKGLVIALFTGQPIFYLYADKDAFLLPVLKRKFKLKGVKIYGTLHWPYEKSQEFSFYKNNLEKEFNGIITLSNSLSEYISRKKITIPHGIDLEFWKSVNNNSVKNFYFLLGQSNRDHIGQVEIIKFIKQKDPSSSFIFLSSDKKKYELYESLESTMVIKEKITDDELKNIYLEAKAVILIQNSSLASNVVMESMAMGVPLIVNNIGDISEYIGSQYPLYVDLNNLDTSNITTFIASKDYRDKIREYLLLRAKNYSWEEISNKTLTFILSN